MQHTNPPSPLKAPLCWGDFLSPYMHGGIGKCQAQHSGPWLTYTLKFIETTPPPLDSFGVKTTDIIYLIHNEYGLKSIQSMLRRYLPKGQFSISKLLIFLMDLIWIDMLKGSKRNVFRYCAGEFVIGFLF